MKNISAALDQANDTYAKIIQMGDSDAEQEEDMSDFLNIYDLKKIAKQKTYNKGPQNPSHINLILTNCYRSFQNIYAIETRLSISVKLPHVF